MLNFNDFFQDFAKMQFKPWRLITAAIHPRFRAIPGESGRAAVPQMTHTPWRWAAISATNFSRPAGRSPADLRQHVLDLLLDCAVDGLGKVDFPSSRVHPRLRERARRGLHRGFRGHTEGHKTGRGRAPPEPNPDTQNKIRNDRFRTLPRIFVYIMHSN